MSLLSVFILHDKKLKFRLSLKLLSSFYGRVIVKNSSNVKLGIIFAWFPNLWQYMQAVFTRHEPLLWEMVLFLLDQDLPVFILTAQHITPCCHKQRSESLLSSLPYMDNYFNMKYSFLQAKWTQEQKEQSWKKLRYFTWSRGVCKCMTFQVCSLKILDNFWNKPAVHFLNRSEFTCLNPFPSEI